MGRIKSRSIQHHRRAPVFWWHCVVSDQTVWKLEEHVSYGLAAGVRLFNFINLVAHFDPEECPVGLVTDMPREDLERVPALFDPIFHMIKSNGGSYISDSLMERVREKLDSYDAEDRTENDRRHYALQPEGMTRDCLDPWTYVKVASSSGVMPCCRTPTPVAYLNEGKKLDGIMNSSEMKALRESLLTGRLKEVCRTCNIRGWTEPEKLNFKVNLFLKFGKYLPILHRWGILLPLLHRWRRSE
jgi:Iron-sulfur cluster-binding domain